MIDKVKGGQEESEDKKKEIERETIAMEIGTRDKRELEVEVRRRGAAAA